jgi:hypothetical protein
MQTHSIRTFEIQDLAVLHKIVQKHPEIINNKKQFVKTAKKGLMGGSHDNLSDKSIATLCDSLKDNIHIFCNLMRDYESTLKSNSGLNAVICKTLEQLFLKKQAAMASKRKYNKMEITSNIDSYIIDKAPNNSMKLRLVKRFSNIDLNGLSVFSQKRKMSDIFRDEDLVYMQNNVDYNSHFNECFIDIINSTIPLDVLEQVVLLK